MGMMDDIEKLAQKARDLAEDHPDQVRKVLDQAEDQLDKRTGGEHAGQIDAAGDKVADFLAPDAHETSKNPPAS
jgi:MT0933-like antitoxin protein